jgi:hypothetical protein
VRLEGVAKLRIRSWNVNGLDVWDELAASEVDVALLPRDHWLSEEELLCGVLTLST